MARNRDHASEYTSVGNEPTDPHPSTIREEDRVQVDVRSRISKFEGLDERPSTPSLRYNRTKSASVINEIFEVMPKTPKICSIKVTY